MGNKELKINEADALLWNLVKTWRELFIQFGELLPPGVALQKGIELPEDLKKKLTESITKTLEKEM
jgi:translation initiation factor 2 alpha subunit (eIF-2alpha)